MTLRAFTGRAPPRGDYSSSSLSEVPTVQPWQVPTLPARAQSINENIVSKSLQGRQGTSGTGGYLRILIKNN